MSSLSANHITNQLDSSQKDVIRTLLYFDIFSYPLRKDEIKQFMSTKQNGKFDQQFNELLELNLIKKVGEDLYSTQNDHSIASRRLKGNELAEHKMLAARKMSKVISFFPFVRGIMLSGSISKGFMQDDSDVDFFIVTAPNRLWIARTMLVFFKRLFLFNSRKFFCVNYFVDTSSMEIEERNIFTAIESATLIPTYGREYYQQFWRENDWVDKFLPNSSMREIKEVPVSNRNIFKWLVEKLLSNFPGDYLDKLFMKMTLSHWKSRYSKGLSKNDFSIAFKTTRNVSKCHPQFFQKKVLESLSNKIEAFELVKTVNLKD